VSFSNKSMSVIPEHFAKPGQLVRPRYLYKGCIPMLVIDTVKVFHEYSDNTASSYRWFYVLINEQGAYRVFADAWVRLDKSDNLAFKQSYYQELRAGYKATKNE